MSLRRAVKALAGQDVQRCQACMDCDAEVRPGMDIPFSGMVQLVLLDDVEVLQCRTVWSEVALASTPGACKRGLDLHAVILALQQIAAREQTKN
jgi:hypothetical protein